MEARQITVEDCETPIEAESQSNGSGHTPVNPNQTLAGSDVTEPSSAAASSPSSGGGTDGAAPDASGDPVEEDCIPSEGESETNHRTVTQARPTGAIFITPEQRSQ